MTPKRNFRVKDSTASVEWTADDQKVSLSEGNLSTMCFPVQERVQEERERETIASLLQTLESEEPESQKVVRTSKEAQHNHTRHNENGSQNGAKEEQVDVNANAYEHPMSSRPHRYSRKNAADDCIRATRLKGVFSVVSLNQSPLILVNATAVLILTVPFDAEIKKLGNTAPFFGNNTITHAE